ncbi:sugar kinase [Fuscovulum ytuae]|uniref:Sugar kinase n=1 Tax=Fuscovulum ytuae TaxID=3042299 RepID=A0ABY8Q3X7_9RHOB|nr:sugar kinase [Fuscovulum sp. YMD61]WGV15307.1 sugar kinase [Fuscovulum sp. YMD61]
MKMIRHRSVRAIGEAMVEMAPVGDGLYRRGYAGDTYNTAWHMAQWLGLRAEVGMITRLGEDRLSDAFVEAMAADGMAVSGISRDPARRMGLYMIELDGVERSFHYWRDTSAARHLADDPGFLANALHGVGLVHLSGITLAILSPDGRDRLLAALADFRAAGGVVALDPNIRPRLWSSLEEMRAALTRMMGQTDIALPSLDDERTHFGDADAMATVRRLQACGVDEVVVKDGPGPVILSTNGSVTEYLTPPVAKIVDTTGAGDAFNAGYLAARMMGRDAAECVGAGQRMAAAVLSQHGALATKSAVSTLPKPDSVV